MKEKNVALLLMGCFKLTYGSVADIPVYRDEKKSPLKIVHRSSADTRKNGGRLYYYGARYYAAWLGRWTATDPMAGERSWVNPYNYCQNNPINRTDPTGALDEGDDPPAQIEVTGTYWKQRISKEVGDGTDIKGILKAYNTALTALNTSLNDVEDRGREYAKGDWGGNSPATITNEESNSGVKVVYGKNDDGEELFFTLNVDMVEGKQDEGSWYDPILDFLGMLDDKTNGGGGIRFTWGIGQGQETRVAKYKDIKTVAIDDVMSLIGGAKYGFSNKNWKNIGEILNVAYSNFDLGQGAVDVLNNNTNTSNSGKTDTKAKKKSQYPYRVIHLQYHKREDGNFTSGGINVYLKDSARRRKSLENKGFIVH